MHHPCIYAKAKLPAQETDTAAFETLPTFKNINIPNQGIMKTVLMVLGA
jgi:hypothetical protein